MFEDSLVESAGRIHTRSRHYVVGTTLLEVALLTTLAILPYLYPDALPRRLLAVPLISPPPPAAAPAPRQAPASATQPVSLAPALTAPTHIPAHLSIIADTPPAPIGVIGTDGSATGTPGGVPWLDASAAPPPPHVRLARPAGPLRVTSGTAQARLIVPIRPQYPPIALATHTQGWVIVDAVISTTGRIENIQVISGSPLLIPSTLDAVRQARYRPFLLNGQPVEAETTISVHFTLN